MLAFKLQQNQIVNPDMKTNRLILFAAAIGVAGFTQAQTQDDIKGLKWNENTTNLELVSINPENPNEIIKSTQVPLYNDKRYMPNTMSYVEEDNRLYFFTQSNSGFVRGFTTNQQFEIANLETGGIIKSIPMHFTTLMAPFILPGKNQLGFIATERTHNGYGNNDDNISLSIFDMNSGEIAHRIELPSLSMSATATPFVGKTSTPNPNGFNMVDTDVSISSPCVIPSTDELLFAAKDVTGVNRLYRIDMKHGVLVSKSSINFDVLDMAYDAENDIVHTLYINKENGVRSLVLGDMSRSGTLLNNNTIVHYFTDSEKTVTDGEVEFDVDAGLLTVVKINGNHQLFYTYDTDHTLVNKTQRYKTTGNIDVEFPTQVVYPDRIEFENLVKMYPNPAQDALTIETENLTTVTRITVFDNIGQEVKDVDVQSNDLMNSIDISALKPGIYMVEIQSTGVTTVTKKLVVQ